MPQVRTKLHRTLRPTPEQSTAVDPSSAGAPPTSLSPRGPLATTPSVARTGVAVAVPLLLVCLVVGLLSLHRGYHPTAPWISVVGGLVGAVILMSELRRWLRTRRDHPRRPPDRPLHSWDDVPAAQSYLQNVCAEPHLRIGHWDATAHAYRDHCGELIPSTHAVVSYGSAATAPHAGQPVLMHLTPQLMQAIHDAMAEEQRLRDHLHDGTQHHLVSTCLRLRLMEERVATTGEQPDASALTSIRHTIGSCADELNRLVEAPDGCCPPTWADVRALASRSPIPVEWLVDEDTSAAVEKAGPTVTSMLYFTVAEALTNALKHSHATQISVAVQVTPLTHLRGTIRNDGCSAWPPRTPVGRGVEAMRRRFLEAGGTFVFAVDSEHAIITFTMPIDVQESGAQ